MSVECVCIQCGNHFTARPSIVKKGGGKFCCYKCGGAWKSEHMSGNNSPNKGVKWSDERKNNFKTQFVTPPSRKGIPSTQEHKLKLSQAKIGCTPWNKGKILPPLTEEHKKKIGKGLEINYQTHPESILKRSGQNNGGYVHGEAIKKYCYKFDGVNGVKKRSLLFFNYKCIECGKPNEQNKKECGCNLSVHHVYYRKMSCCENELEYESGILKKGNKLFIKESTGNINEHDIIGKHEKFAVLCSSCHAKTTSHNRYEWIKHYENKINNEYGGKSFLTKEEYIS